MGLRIIGVKDIVDIRNNDRSTGCLAAIEATEDEPFDNKGFRYITSVLENTIRGFYAQYIVGVINENKS